MDRPTEMSDEEFKTKIGAMMNEMNRHRRNIIIKKLLMTGTILVIVFGITYYLLKSFACHMTSAGVC